MSNEGPTKQSVSPPDHSKTNDSPKPADKPPAGHDAPDRQAENVVVVEADRIADEKIKKHAPGAETGQPLLDQQKIEKAEAFLRSGQISDVSPSAKRNYLETKAGMSRQEIDVALERVAARERAAAHPHLNEFDNKNELADVRRRSFRDHEFASNLGPDFRGSPPHMQRSRRRYEDEMYRDAPLRRHPNQHFGEVGQDRWGEGPRQGYMPNQMHSQYGAQPPNFQSPTRYGPMEYNGMSANPGAYPMQPHVANHIDEEDRDPPSSSLMAWAGGFSLGVFFLAALRWLNGGDFVLFPSPTASGPQRLRHGQIGVSERDEQLDNPDKAVNSSVARHEEEEEDDDDDDEGEDEDEDEGSNEGENEISTSTEGPYDDVDSEPNGNGVKRRKNDSENSQYLNPQLSRPSYGDLATEIKALTSAIHSYRDTQERANRAANAQVGRAMTNNAMDFLRLKKSSSDKEKDKTETEPVTSPSSKHASGEIINERGISMIFSLLKEVKNDVRTLKGQISQANQTNEVSNQFKEDDKDGKVGSENNDGGDSNGVNSCLADNVMEKIGKIMEIIGEKDPNENRPITIDKSEVKEELTIAKEKDASTENEASPVDNKTASEDKDTMSPLKLEAHDGQNHLKSTISPSEHTEQLMDDQTLEDSISNLSKNNNLQELKTGAQILYLYFTNISKNPTVPRYRKIFTNNDSFRTKVGNLVGIKEFLRSVGFVERANFFEWEQSYDDSFDAKSRLDFARVALEAMRNGSTSNDGAATSPSQTQQQVPLTPSPTLSMSSLNGVTLASSDVGKSIELN